MAMNPEVAWVVFMFVVLISGFGLLLYTVLFWSQPGQKPEGDDEY